MPPSVQPKVSVIMPVKDGALFLSAAIESILSQSYTNIEFIILNDGSMDETEAIVRSYSDPRIVYRAYETSLGLATRLNEGIAFATGDYIARMDADDVALKTRLEKQVTFLEAHPEISLVGTWARFIDEKGEERGQIYRTPVTHEEILFRACFANPFIHPSVMVRASDLRANLYNETYRRSQDLELWSRLLFVENVRAANLPEPLLLYRRHAASLTKKKNAEDYLRSAAIPLKNMKNVLPLTQEQEALFLKAYLGEALTLVQLIKRMRLSFLFRNAFVLKYPSTKETFRQAPWKDVRFFLKYFVKQLIRSKAKAPVAPIGA
jgi:glycosyltransferase involved in cell wall biosynthesis